jgi:hypothetical protein
MEECVDFIAVILEDLKYSSLDDDGLKISKCRLLWQPAVATVINYLRQDSFVVVLHPPARAHILHLPQPYQVSRNESLLDDTT